MECSSNKSTAAGALKLSWEEELAYVNRVMKTVSLIDDPQEMVLTYGNALDRLFPTDKWIALSRRDLSAPYFRVTRSWRYADDFDPWKHRDTLPLLTGGLLGQIAYANEPILLHDFNPSPSDPGFYHLEGVRSLVAMPQYDHGEGLNVGIAMWATPHAFDPSHLPNRLWQANLFGRTTHGMRLRKELAAANTQIEREIKIIGEIQRSLLPHELPQIQAMKLAAHYRTSQRAGGDYYDIFPLPENQWGLFIADVSGHGTPAAVMMAITHALAHAHPGHPMPPDALLNNLNERLCRHYTNHSATFITAFYGIFDPEKKTFTYTSAGHNPPRLIRSNRVLPLNDAAGLPLGINPEEHYTRSTFQLESRDQLLLYTDGIVEAFSPTGDQFSAERLDEVLRTVPCDPHKVIAAIQAAVNAFTHDAPPADDQTVLAVWIR